MRIDIISKDALYIEINDHIYYIDDSTNEQIVSYWLQAPNEPIVNLH